MSKCRDCRGGDYSDTLQCEQCYRDICNKDACINIHGFSCIRCQAAWCDACLEDASFCDFCDTCIKCESSLTPCTGCEGDPKVLEKSLPYMACTSCRVNRGWVMYYEDDSYLFKCPFHARLLDQSDHHLHHVKRQCLWPGVVK
jgi:hypothetical protein